MSRRWRSPSAAPAITGDDDYRIENAALTVAGGGKPDLTATRELGSDLLRIAGTRRAGHVTI